MPSIPPELESAVRFIPQKQDEFERLMKLEFPKSSLAKSERGGYLDAQTEKLWAFWLQAYWAGKNYLDIERPDE